MIPVSNRDIGDIAHEQLILTRYSTPADEVVIEPFTGIGGSLIVTLARYPKPVVQQNPFCPVTAKSAGLDLIKNLPAAHLFMVQSYPSGHFNDRTFLFN